MNTDKFKLTWILLFCDVVFLCGPDLCQAKDKLNIVTTVTPLESIAKAVGGNHVNVSSIGSGDEDPHFIQAKPSYMMKAKKADLWIRVGLELEIGYEGLILEGSRNPRIQIGTPGHLDVSEGIMKLEVPTEKVDRSMGDVHPLGNPHYWLDPYNGRIIAWSICQRLKQLDPANADDYEHNLDAFLLKLDSAAFGEKLANAAGGERLWKMQSNGTLENFIKDYNEKVTQAKKASSQSKEEAISLDGWFAKLKPFENSKIVTYHRSWSYFVHRFNLDVVAELEPKPGIPPNPSHVLQVIETMKSDKVKVILMEPFYERQSAQTVAGKTGAKVIVVPNAPDDHVETYIGMFDNIVTKLADALSQG
jgi:ABC-type Zn uptake system ZnuABC Zn-binding protein ZnuA